MCWHSDPVWVHNIINHTSLWLHFCTGPSNSDRRGFAAPSPALQPTLLKPTASLWRSSLSNLSAFLAVTHSERRKKMWGLMTQDSFRLFVPLPLTEYKKLKWEQNRVPFRRHGAHALCLRTFLICSQWWRETAAYNGVSFAVHYWYGRTKGMIVLQTFWSTRRVCGITVRWQTFRHLLAVSVLSSFSAPQVSFRDWEDNALF